MKKEALLSFLQKKFPDFEKEYLYAAILCGECVVNGEAHRDPKVSVMSDAVVEFRRDKYVSRGGLKLEKALSAFGIDPVNKVFIDAGASTGGFTHCLLTNGAKKVYSVDVGYNQLDYRMRTDPRVAVMERSNIMEIEISHLDPVPHAGVLDLSFRSVVPAAAHLLSFVTEGWVIALVKPQFEVPRYTPGFTGVIEDDTLLESILERVKESILLAQCRIAGIIPSPIKGRKGNREYLFHITR